MSDRTAPHLPDATTSTKVEHFFGIREIVFSVVGGILGGALVLRFIAPSLFLDVVSSLSLSPSLIKNKEQEAASSFVDMIRVAHILTSENGKVVGTAVGFSSDGWLVSESKSLMLARNIVVDGVSYPITAKSKIKDQMSGVSFFKVNTSRVSSPRVIDDAQFHAGDSVSIVSPQFGVFSATVSVPYGAIETKTGTYSSELLYRVVVLDRLFESEMWGSPVFDIRGAFIGVLSFDPAYANQSIVIPAHYFLRAFRSASKFGNVQHPYVGINSSSQFTTGIDVSVLKNGVLIAGNVRYGIPGVVFNSPAWQAGLRDHDRILAIDEQPVGTIKTLPEQLVLYEPGQEIRVTYEREGKEYTTKLKLGLRL